MPRPMTSDSGSSAASAGQGRRERRAGLYVLVACAVGVCAMLAWRGSGSASGRPSSAGRIAASDERIAALEQRLAENEAILAQMTEVLDRLEARSGTRSASMRASAPEPDAQASAAIRDRTIAGYEQEFRAQTQTSNWGQKTADLLRSRAYSNDLVALTPVLPVARDVSCRATMCRMVFTFASAAEATDWADAYQAMLGSSVGRIWSTTMTDADGTARVAMYGFK